MPKKKDDNIIIYESEDGKITIDVQLINETVWLSLSQLSKLFCRDKSVISRHLSNIFTEGELDRTSTVAFFATAQQEGSRTIEREIEYFNLDAILSVGYRVNSKQGTLFRRWSSNVLQDYLIQGYALNQQKLTTQKISELEQTIDLLSRTLINQELVTDLGSHVIEIIKKYAKTWSVLLEYDENRLTYQHTKNPHNLVDIEYKDVISSILSLKEGLIKKGEASQLFGLERQGSLRGILGSISQTFDSLPIYTSNIERAANLLYFIIKDHPFADGNKRIGCFVFLIFLKESNIELNQIDNTSIIALALLIAESHPTQKEIIIKLVMRLLTK